jgi:uncharacterized protein YlxW (UPF0749 family)
MERIGGMETNSLTAPMAELTEAVRSLTKLKQSEQATVQRTAAELPRVIREEFTAPMRALNDSIHELTASLKDMHRDRAQTTATLEDLIDRLTDRLTEQRTSPGISRTEGHRFWPKRSLVSSQRPTA